MARAPERNSFGLTFRNPGVYMQYAILQGSCKIMQPHPVASANCKYLGEVEEGNDQLNESNSSIDLNFCDSSLLCFFVRSAPGSHIGKHLRLVEERSDSVASHKLVYLGRAMAEV